MTGAFNSSWVLVLSQQPHQLHITRIRRLFAAVFFVDKPPDTIGQRSFVSD